MLWLLTMISVAVSPCSTSALRLDWVRTERAAECPTGDEVAARIAERLQCTPFGPNAAAWFEVLVEPTDDGPGWRARVTRYDADNVLVSDKVLHSQDPDCAVLRDVVALTLAFVAEQLPVLPSIATTATATAPIAREDLARARVPIIVSSTVAPNLEISAPPRGSVAIECVVDVGTLSRPALGVRLGTTFRLSELAGLELGALVLPVQPANAYFFGLAAGWLGACIGTDPTRRTRVRGCGRLYGGVLTGFPSSVARPVLPGAFPWGAASVGTTAEAALTGPVYVRLGVEALITLADRKFAAQTDSNVIVVLDEAPIALLASLGVVIRFK